METLKLLLLAILISSMGNSAFCQTKRVYAKARKTTVSKVPSAALIKGCNSRLVNFYFFNYMADSHKANIAFKAANASGKGTGVIFIPDTDEKTIFNYRIHADGNIYITLNGITKKILFISTPAGMVLNGIVSQREYSPDKYEELINLINQDRSDDEHTYALTTKTSAQNDNDSKVFDVVEQQASFPGGNSALQSFLASQVKYPVVAMENGISGRVVVEFVVERDGSLTDVKVVRSVDPSLDKEAIRVVKSMPKWSPGKLNGTTVRVRHTVPVVFRLQ